MGLFNPKPGSTFLASLFSQLPVTPLNYNLTTDMTLTQDMFAISLVINPGVTLFTSGWRVYVLTSLINNGTISNTGVNGNNGTNLAGGLGGQSTNTGLLGNGAQGANGVFNNQNGINGVSTGNCLTFNGVSGGNAVVRTGGNGGVATPPVFNFPNILSFLCSFNVYYILDGLSVELSPNAGAGSGAADTGSAGSGGAGSGGGCIFIAANSIINNNLITTRGGNAGLPFNNAVTPVGGSAGGNGGFIALFASSIFHGMLVTDGGHSSNGVNGGGTPGNGSAGNTYISTLV